MKKKKEKCSNILRKEVYIPEMKDCFIPISKEDVDKLFKVAIYKDGKYYVSTNDYISKKYKLYGTRVDILNSGISVIHIKHRISIDELDSLKKEFNIENVNFYMDETELIVTY